MKFYFKRFNNTYYDRVCDFLIEISKYNRTYALAKSTIKLSNKKYLETVEFQNSAVFLCSSAFSKISCAHKKCVLILSCPHNLKRRDKVCIRKN